MPGHTAISVPLVLVVNTPRGLYVTSYPSFLKSVNGINTFSVPLSSYTPASLPAAPAAPLEPLEPLEPLLPAGPCGPVAPWGPVSPVSPLAPSPTSEPRYRCNSFISSFNTCNLYNMARSAGNTSSSICLPSLKEEDIAANFAPSVILCLSKLLSLLFFAIIYTASIVIYPP